MSPERVPQATSVSPLGGPQARLDRLRANLTGLYDRIEAARRRSPGAAARTTLLVVTKAAPADAFDLLVRLGERDVGENRVLDAVAKREGAPTGLVWHGIGHLQTNKAKKAVAVFDVFHALDSLHLADALEPLLAARGRTWPVYLQVNAARDPAKGGVDPDRVPQTLDTLAERPHLEVVGLMAMAREGDAGEAARPCFKTLREVRDEVGRRGAGRSPPLGLSMGMTDDFEVAVEEGATLVRVGRAVWEGLVPPPAPGAGLDASPSPRRLRPKRT